MEIGILVVAAAAAFLAFRFIAGIVKFVILGVIVLGALYFAGVLG